MKIPKRSNNIYLTNKHIKFNLDLDYIPICSILNNVNSHYVDTILDTYKLTLNNYYDLVNIKNKNLNYTQKITSIASLRNNMKIHFDRLYKKLFSNVYYTIFCNYSSLAVLNNTHNLFHFLTGLASLKKDELISGSDMLYLYKSFYDKKEKFCFYLIGNYMLFDVKYNLFDKGTKSDNSISNAIDEINNKIDIRSINLNKFDLQYILTIDKDYVKYGVMFEEVNPKYLRLYVNKSYVDNPNLKGKIDKIVIPYYKEQNVEIVYEDSLDYFINKPIQRPKKIGEDLSNQVLKRFVSCLKLQHQ